MATWNASADDFTGPKLIGTITQFEEDNFFGFIKADKRLPGAFSNVEVFFSLDVVVGTGIRKGDVVEFLLNTEIIDNPEAFRIWPIGHNIGDETQEKVGTEGSDGDSPSLEITNEHQKTDSPYIADEQTVTDFFPPDTVFEQRKRDSPPLVNLDELEDKTSKRDSSPQNATSGQRKRESPPVNTANEQRQRDNPPQVPANEPRGRDRTQQRRRGSPKIVARGKICKVLDSGNGFIEVFEDGLPEQFKGFKNIFFMKEWIPCGEIPLLPGDQVEFNISKSTRHENELTGHRFKLLKCRPRGPHEIQHYIRKLTETVEGASNTDTEVILSILSCEAAWKVIGRCWAMENETISELLDLLELLKNKSKALSQNFVQMLQMFASTDFCNSQRSCLKLFVEESWSTQQEEYQKKIKQFLFMILDHLPGKARMVATLVKSMIPPGKDSTEHFLYMIIRKISSLNLEDISDFEWNELPTVPSSTELMMSPFEFCERLTPAKVHGPYDSVEEYMDTHFRLLRADCISSLRIGIQKYLENALDPRDMNVYSEVALHSVQITNRGNGIVLGLKVKPLTEVDDWETCSNLMFGSLLCLSPSGSFKDTIWATVMERDPKLLKSDQIIWVELCSVCNYKDDTTCITNLMEASGRTILAESPTYYLAYQPVLKALQNINPETLAFKEELVHLEAPSPPASFDFAQVESMEDMDKSQQEAFLQALSQRIGIIQGPPGTGKTYIGILLIKHFLQQEIGVKFPILILTYKNHALDEFIKAVLRFLPDGVVRVGGRSQAPELDVCNLFTLRKKHPRTKANIQQKAGLTLEANELKGMVENLLRELKATTQFSVETALKGFAVSQLEKLLIGSKLLMSDGWKKKRVPVDKDVFEQIWLANKDILSQTDLSPRDMMNELDQVVVDVLHNALEEWVPPPEAFDEIMKGEERLSRLIAAQVEECAEDKESFDIEDFDFLLDGMDLEDELRERLAAVWIQHQNEDVVVRFREPEKGGGRQMPYIGPTAQRLAAQVPLLALRGIRDLWALAPYDRALVIQVVLWYQKAEVEKELQQVLGKYKQILGAIKELDDEHKVSILQEKKIVGMTITGASIHRNLLQTLRPEIIIIEEAAEVLEPQLIAVLGDWVKHMILIGDHKQLRPRVDSYLLARDHHLDVSMMERLVDNNYPYATLQMQNRMRPEMVPLLEDIYPELTSNLPRVQKNVAPDFIPSMFFWAHEDPETLDRSFSNVKEADRAIQLALLFLEQGYRTNQISILGAYQAQVKLLRQKLAKAEKNHAKIFEKSRELDDARSDPNEQQATIKVHTIDMYQGDENEIVIISMVRSNPESSIGFMKTANRRCVAQSRAQCGMYFIGNVVTFMKAKDSCWLNVIKKMRAQDLLDMRLPLHCRYHQDASKVEAVTARDIPLTGLCKRQCQLDMDCGLHPCKKKCQPFHEHTANRCNELVQFLHANCGHPGERKCREPEASIPCLEPCQTMMECGKHPCPSHCQPAHPHDASYCVVLVPYQFPTCGHTKKKKCGEDEAKLRCEAKLPFQFENCQHYGRRKCWQTPKEVICGEKCTRTLTCGHPCEDLCGNVCDVSKCKPCEKKREIEKQKQREAEEKVREEARKKARQELEEFNKKHPRPSEECHRQELHKQGDTASEFYDVYDQVRKFIQPGHNWFPDVKKIEKVTNLKLQKKWLETKSRMFDPTRSAMKFHGTGDEGVEGITKNGFRMPQEGGMYGKGVYFATDSSKSAQDIYTKGSNKLLLCDVLLGKSYTAETAVPNMNSEKLRKKQYDSLYAPRDTKNKGGVIYDEYIVYVPAQALPKYIIHYEKCSLEDTRLSLRVQGGTQVRKHSLFPKREVDLNDPLDLHFRLAESQFHRLKAHTGLNANITSIDYWTNPNLIEKFVKMQQDLKTKYKGGKEAKPILAFHGTAAANIDNIVNNNFDISKIKRGSYGAGMYFSEFPDVSMGYAGGTNKLILCRVLPGRSFQCTGPMYDAPLKQGYDSHIVGADAQGRGQEVVIYNADQVLPLYVINF